MKLYQPFLYVGLGGTGIQIGTELERRFREGICGPDGAAFTAVRANAMRYELPACAQFVYADVNQSALDKLPAAVVPGPQHVPAARLTQHLMRGLVPRAGSYSEVARDLRLTAEDAVTSWLPPTAGEPHVAPLEKGAGQFPTIGRASLFTTFKNGAGLLVQNLDEAIGKLATAQAIADLAGLAEGGHGDPAAVDVFIGFSVAGGTGAGIFYDFMHLIGHRFAQTGLRPKIYPLVVMPSAFPDGLGGGRPARLNASRALLDLFRLVDQQNGREHRDDDRHPDEIPVRYPHLGRVVLPSATAQTGFLFSRPAGAEPDDLRRSIASFVTALAGTELDTQRVADGVQPQSFTDSFINWAHQRQTPASNGIGDRGVSTALVTSLTVPDDELADLVAGRLLSEGIDDLMAPPAGAETNDQLIERFFTDSGLRRLFVRQEEDFAEPPPVKGAHNITKALHDRADAMRAGLAELRARLDREVPDMVDNFDPREATLQLLGEYDPFRVQRIVSGHQLSGEMSRLGAAGLLNRRAQPPVPPEGITDTPPPVPKLRDKLGGFTTVKWDDAGPVQARQEQDRWYRYKTNVEWVEPWSSLRRNWLRLLREAGGHLDGLTEALVSRAHENRDDFRARTENLSRSRVGVSYLLPPDRNLETFCERALRRITDLEVDAGRLRPGAGRASLLCALLGAKAWRAAFTAVCDTQPADQTVSALKSQLKAEIKRYFRVADAERHALLPRLADQLADAAAQREGALAEQELAQFRAKLQGLVPPAFTPQGTGPLTVLVSYPAGARHEQLEHYLEQAVNLPRGQDVTFEFTPTSAESITVVLFRTSMGITEVGEVRDVLKAWSEALTQPRDQDFLRWRQRTGYDFGYLATHEEHRIHILHRLLCALWNGGIDVNGAPESPKSITVKVGDERVVLPLDPLDRASSWGTVLQAYERWAIAGDDPTQQAVAERLLRAEPADVSTRPRPPHEHYVKFRAISDKQVDEIDRMLDGLTSGARARALQLRRFWSQTLPDALDMEFLNPQAIRRNLRELERAVDDLPPGAWEGR